MSVPPHAEALQLVIARPKDRDARLVWADELTARGEPRGEFIALQCLERPTELQQRRMRALRRRHEASWSAGLWPLVSSGEVRFEWGALVSCTLSWAEPAVLEAIELSPEAQLVSQVRTTRRYVPEEQSLGALLAQLRGLRVVRDVTVSEVLAVLDAGIPLEAIQLARSVKPSALERIHAPALRRLGVALEGDHAALDAFLGRHQGIEEVDVGLGRPASWRRRLKGRVQRVRVRVPGWSFQLSKPDLVHLEVYASPDGRGDHAPDLIEALEAFEIAELDYIHVRSGRPPERSSLVALQRAARGTPLLLPARWRQRL